MKKTYLQPEVSVVNDELQDSLLTGSLNLSGKTVSGSDGGWAKEDNAWDIWGGDEEE